MLKDMGFKDSAPAPTEAKSPKVRYPSLSLDKNIPEELMGKDIGDTCRLELVVKVMGKSINQYSEDKNERIELEIHKCGYLSGGGKTKDEYIEMSEDDRAEYDKDKLETEEEPEEPEEK